MKSKKKIIERLEYKKRCPICKREIKGTSESQVEYNLKTHTQQKHHRAKHSKT
jgi:uncharacterized protein with PIN domain